MVKFNLSMIANADSIKAMLRLKIASILSIVFAITVFGAAIYFARMRSANLIREQIINRDASVLYSAICLMRDEYVAAGISDMDSPADQMNLILRISNLKGVVAVRLFNRNGEFENGLPVSVRETHINESDLMYLKSLMPRAKFHKAITTGDLFYFVPDDFKNGKRMFSILEINIPLHKKNNAELTGIAQFLLEGASVEQEFTALDRNLNTQAVTIFIIGSILITAGLGFAFHKLYRRTIDLQKANRELALVARTSALGAITANLLHGLKNPLTGLHIFASEKASNGQDATLEWEQALKSIQKMKIMITEVANLIKEESGATNIEITTEELAGMVLNKTKPLAQQRSVILNIENNDPQKSTLPGRIANLVSIILVNLLENAIDATPQQKNVWLKIGRGEGIIIFEVIDEGCGLPPEMIENPFLPRASSKPGGSGIGLAISRQLANHIGAELRVKSTSNKGTSFELLLPA